MQALVLQHIACEPPGVFEDVLHERGAELHRVELDEGEPLPDWQDFAAIVAMGGPMSANDDSELPWLAAEKRLIGDAVRGRYPVLGRLPRRPAPRGVARRAGLPGPEPEVGLLPVELTVTRAPIRSSAGAGDLVTLQWHGDTFDLPDGAVRLAELAGYANQAFRFERAYGVQFHLEVSAEMAREWAEVPEYVASLERTLGAEGAPEFLAAIEANAEDMQATGRSLFERWLDRVVAARLHTRPQTPRGERSSSATFIRSRIETIPTTRPSSTTGRWRKPPWIISDAA